MKPDHERVTKLLSDTVTLLCKNGLSYNHELRIQGLLGITVDSNEVFLVSINDCFGGSSSTSLASVPSVPDSAATVTCSSQSRKRSSDDIVDLTRLVETPNVHTAVPPSHLRSSISPMHRATPTRPKSAGSVTHTRSQPVTPSSSNVTSTRHSQPVARQPPFIGVATCGHFSGRTNSTEHLMSANTNSRHSNALALVDSSAVRPGQRLHAGYIDSIHNLMLSCERQLDPRCCPRGHYHRQPSAAGASGWPGSEQQHFMQRRQMHQNVASVGRVLGVAAEDASTVGRAGAEHFSNPPQPGRQPMVPTVPGNACIRRAEADPLHYMNTRTAVPGVNPPSTLPRHRLPGVTRPVYDDYLQYAGNVQRAHVAADGRQLVNSAAYFQPPAKRHALNRSTRQAVPSFNPAYMQSQLPLPHGYFSQDLSALLSQPTCSTADDVNSLSLSSVTNSPASTSLVIKPPPSPVRSGHKSRSRQVEHIDLCGDDETADSEVHIPVSSIVIQPDNTDMSAASAEVEGSYIISMNTSDSYGIEFETAAETILSESDIPPLSRIHEIVPLDDGLDNEDDVSMMQNRVAAETTGQLASASFSNALVTSGLSDSAQSSAVNHSDSELSVAQLDVSEGLLSTSPHNQIGINSELAQLSADESRQMAELYFDTEDSDMHAQI